MNISRLTALIALLTFVTACASTQRTDAKPAVEPASLLPSTTLAYDFFWRQRVSARWPTGHHDFDAVLQKRRGELTLVGMSPLGLPGFVFRLRADGQIDIENRSDRELPFEARYVLVDVERVFFPWFDDGIQPPPTTGERSTQHGDSHVVERYTQGKLMVREFERATSKGPERVKVSYQHTAQSQQDAPKRAVLENSLLRYTLTIETLEQSRLQQ